MKGRLFLVLFALPFAGVGAWMAWSLGTMTLEVRAMRGWQPVSAEVLSGGYNTHSGDDSDTYEAFATYRYRVDGRSYTGDRVQLTGGADNIGDYQQATGRRLERAAAEGRPITVYVDPGDPRRSIVDRNVRWGLAGFKTIFLLLFGGVGAGLLVFAVRAPRAGESAPAESASAPWLANPAWREPTIRSNSRKAMWGAWLFAVFWNLVSAPLPFLLYDEIVRKENYLALLGLLFPVIGVVLLAWALRRTLEWRRFGPTPVTLDPFPGSIGGHVGGVIDTNLPPDANRRIRLVLSSVFNHVTGSGKNRSRSERVLWQDEVLAHTEPGPNGTRLAFRFDVPDGLEESAAVPSGDEYHLWRLTLKCELPGTDLEREFDIPVYRTAQSSKGVDAGRAGAPERVQDAHYEQAARRRLRITQGTFGKTLVYPMGQALFGNLIGIVVGGSFAAAGAWLAIKEGHRLFGSLFGGIGGLVGVLALYLLFKSLHVTLRGDTITSVRRWMGIPVGRRTLRRGEFERFERRDNMQTKSGGDITRYYRICGIDREGNAVVLGENFAGEGEARAAIRLLARELGLRERGRFALDKALFDEDAAPIA